LYWLEWNKIIEKYACFRYRLNDIDVDLIMNLIERTGQPVVKEAVVKALKETPIVNSGAWRTTNIKTQTLAITLNNITNEKIKDDVEKLADKYGF